MKEIVVVKNEEKSDPDTFKSYTQVKEEMLAR